MALVKRLYMRSVRLFSIFTFYRLRSMLYAWWRTKSLRPWCFQSHQTHPLSIRHSYPFPAQAFMRPSLYHCNPLSLSFRVCSARLGFPLTSVGKRWMHLDSVSIWLMQLDEACTGAQTFLSNPFLLFVCFICWCTANLVPTVFAMVKYKVAICFSCW